MDNEKLVRTNNRVRDVMFGLAELGFSEVKNQYSDYPDSIFVNISNKTYTVVNSNGFIEASKAGRLAQYHFFLDGNELMSYVKEFVVTEPAPLATAKPKRTRKKKTETKTEPTND